MKPLNEQVIVITGASSGIGLATARMAAEKGAKVVVSSRNTEDLERIVTEIKAGGGDAIAVTADVKEYTDLEKLRDRAIETYGRIDTWVNNAGVSIYGDLLEVPMEEEEELFKTNFWGVRNGCRVAVPELAKHGGTLINLGSEVSQASMPLQGMYSASKHAVKAYTDALRMELDKDHLPVAVCLIRPAGIDTPFTEHAVNHLREGEPSLPDPVYHPNVVAKAIVECAVHPKRDVYAGGASKMFSLMAALTPSLADFIAEKLMFKAQEMGAQIPHTAENEGLIHAPAHEGEMRGGHKGPVMPVSPYTSATLHPVIATAAGALLTAGVGIAIRNYLSSENGQTLIKSIFGKASGARRHMPNLASILPDVPRILN